MWCEKFNLKIKRFKNYSKEKRKFRRNTLLILDLWLWILLWKSLMWTAMFLIYDTSGILHTFSTPRPLFPAPNSHVSHWNHINALVDYMETHSALRSLLARPWISSRIQISKSKHCLTAIKFCTKNSNTTN